MSTSWVNLKQQVRPIKLAFLVAPADTKSLLQVIQLNNFLWGGHYNLIVPTYRNLPSFLKDYPVNKLTAKRLFYGYLENFDPDFVVPVGRVEGFDYSLNDYQVLHMGELWKNVNKSGLPDYGIGFYTILNSFIDEELKYKRTIPIETFIPKISGSKKNRAFLGSIVGLLPPKVEEITNKKWQKYTNHVFKDCKQSNYHDILESKALNLLNISRIDLERCHDVMLHDKYCLFILDADKNIDIIDFWNLRALGRTVCPIPIESINDSKIINHAKMFLRKYFTVKKNYNGDDLEYPVTLLKSRSIDAKTTKDFANKIVDNLKKKQNHIVLQNWYPRIWDSWAKEKDGAKYQNYYSDKTDSMLDPKNPSIQINILSPKFIKNEYSTHTPKFANDLSLSVYDLKRTYAEVVPQSKIPFQRSMNCYEKELWRFSSEYLTYLARYYNGKILFSIPKAEALFVEWLDQHDIKNITFSKSADVTRMLIDKMESIGEVDNLAQFGIIKVLEEVGKKDSVTKGELTGIMNRNSVKTVEQQQRIIDWLVKINAILLGFRMSCTICDVESWYSLKEVDYIIECKNCLGTFNVPTKICDIKHAFKAVGPFTVGNQAEGSYSVLLTYRFFCTILDASVTSIFGFKSDNKFETDLGLFYRKKHCDGAPCNTAFVECKTFNHFLKEDVDRMKYLAKRFPGSQIVFATLNQELSTKEKNLLAPFINWSRKIDDITYKPRNEVIILTETELLAKYTLSEAWKSKGDQRKEISEKRRYDLYNKLWDFTQQVYLGLDPWEDWLTRRKR